MSSYSADQAPARRAGWTNVQKAAAAVAAVFLLVGVLGAGSMHPQWKEKSNSQRPRATTGPQVQVSGGRLRSVTRP
jgi:hypothetical protein